MIDEALLAANLELHGANALADVRVIRHETAESIAAHHWRCEEEGITLAELRGCEIGGVTPDGEEASISFDAWMDGMTANGFWGYAATDEREVHLWAGPTATDEQILMLLGHELGHLLEPEFAAEAPIPELNSEAWADTCGAVTLRAFQEWQRLFGDRAALRQLTSSGAAAWCIYGGAGQPYRVRVTPGRCGEGETLAEAVAEALATA